MDYLIVTSLILLVISLLCLHVYGIYHCFKIHVGWGVASIVLSPLAFAVGLIKLVTNKNLLALKHK